MHTIIQYNLNGCFTATDFYITAITISIRSNNKKDGYRQQNVRQIMMRAS